MVLSGQELSVLDFTSTSSTWIRFTSNCSTDSQATLTDFEWIDYCPAVFRSLQELGKIDADDYMFSICGNETIRQLTSPGKSGCLLYLSHDDRFVIKTMRKSEMKVRVIVMGNVFQSDLCIHKRFDLKGSSQGCCVSKARADESTIFKDLDLDVAFHLDTSTRE